MATHEKGTQSDSSPKHGLASMSRETRKEALKKLLVASSPIIVFQESPTRPLEFFVPGKPTQWPSLALDKCREHHEPEADAVFYGLNHFNLVDTSAQREASTLEAFLAASPGSSHAGLLTRLSLSFPALEATPEAPDLKHGGSRCLNLLQNHCVSLETLELYVHEDNSTGLDGEAAVDLRLVQEVLSRINTQLRVISSLQEIVIKYQHGRPGAKILHFMESLGWKVTVTQTEAP